MVLTSLPDLGAKRFLGLDDLTDRQRRAAERVLTSVHALAEEVKRELDEDRSGYERNLVYRHPRYVFVIDGNRGSGKTTLLLTLHHLLSYVGVGEIAVPDKKTRESLGAMKLLEPSKGHPMPPLVLSILNPNEMERGDDIMENIFAQITTFLRKQRGGKEATLATACAALEEKLHSEVALGWSFSRALGVETLSRDSLDYRDFVKQRADQATLSYTRQESWRKFVNEFLDQFSRQLLIVCIDDTDLAPSVTEGILHAIRMYLSHPRIVVLLCMNLKYIRHTLEMLALQRISQALRGLSPQEAEHARWQERQITDEYLYKILPPSLHLRLTLTGKDLDTLYRHYGPSPGPEVNPTWNRGIQQRAMDLQAAGDLVGARSWRLFYDRGSDLLTTLPIREVREFIHLFQELEGPVSGLLEEQLRRGPTFTRLLRRLQERSVFSLEDLLGRQDLNVSWTPTPVVFNVAGTRYRREEPEFLLIEWLIDQSIAANPCRPDLGWLPRLLPQLTLSGGMLESDNGKIGVAAYLAGSPVPRNCLYFRELTQISDVLLSSSSVETTVPLQGDLRSDLEELLRRKNAELVPVHVSKDLISENTDAGEIFRMVVDSLHARSLPPELQSLYRLPALWLLFNTVKGNARQTEEQTLLLLRSWAGLPSEDSAAVIDGHDPEFAEFLIATQRFLRFRFNSEHERQKLLTCALRIATGTTGPGTMPSLKNLLHALGTIETRSATLLLWSAAPVLPDWLESGISDPEVEDLHQLTTRIDSVVVDFQEYRKAKAFEFLDIPEEAQTRMEEDISTARQQIGGLLEQPEAVVIPVRETNPFTLNHVGQIAYILRISPNAAERFLESVKPSRG